MMAYERSESARDNFGKFIQIQPETLQETWKDFNEIM